MWNLIGSAAPLLVAIVAVPILVRGLGLERFGVLTLAWTLIGYLSIFDLGIGRAVTKFVAEKLEIGRLEEVPTVFWSALVMLVFVGGLGALALAAASGWLCTAILNVPINLQPEMRKALYLVAAGIPIVTTSAGLRGVLEAQQRFCAVNVVRVLIGTLGFVAPVAVLHYSTQLTGSIGALVATRAIGWVSYVIVCIYTSRFIFSSLQIRWGTLCQLLQYGGWLTVSNIISPLLVSMDRFMVAGILSVGAVAYYTTPSEIAGKMLAIPIALQTAIFPAFSATSVTMDRNRAALYQRGTETIFIVLYPSTIVAVLFAHDVLRIWLGASFASASTAVLQILAVGVLVNGLAHVPSAALQASGRPDLTAKLHFLELPAYAALVWWLTSRYGIQGTAVAWAVRVATDAVLLFVLARKVGVPVPLPGRSIAAAVVTITICLFLSNVSIPIAFRTLATAGLTIACIWTIRPFVTNLART